MAAEIASQNVVLTPTVSQAAVEFDIAQPMRVHADASVDASQQRLVLIVKPVSASGANRISRVESAGHVTIDTDVTAQDLASHGRRWVAMVSAAQAPVEAVKGRLVVSDGAATAPVTPGAAPPRVGYVPPPPSASSPPPPTPGVLPLPRSGSPPPPSTASAAPPPPPHATAPPPPAGYVPTAVRSGRYRLSLLGATVNRKTTDDDPVAFPPVAKRGDDVFFVADLVEMTAQGTNVPLRRKTLTYGAVPSGNSATQAIAASMVGSTAQERIRAGTMTVDGGLKVGDSVPYAEPWQRKAPNTADRLPMLLWEGTLAEGRNILLVAPTVWEFDDGRWTTGRFRNFSASAADMSRLMLGDLPPRVELFNAINDLARTRGAVVPLPELLNPQVLARFSSGAANQPTNLSGGVIAGVANAMASSSSDRPIGLAYQNGQPVFVPKVLLLNYATAERLVTPPTTPVPSITLPFGTSTPIPQGTLLVQYRDDDSLGGEYVLFLQLERAP